MSTLTSQNLNQHPTPEQVANLSIAQLQAFISNINSVNKNLKEEVFIFESYLKDLDTTQSNLNSGSLGNFSSIGGPLTNVQSSIDSGPESTAESGDDSDHSEGSVASGGSSPRNNNVEKKKKKKKVKRAVAKSLSQLSMDRKLEVTQQRIEVLNAAIEAEKKDFKKKIDNFTAAMEEADIEIESADKEHKEFVRIIMKGGVNPRTGKVLAERLVNYLDNELKQRDQLIDKYRLKNTSIKSHIKKLKQHLEHREEMGEVLSKVDYDQLEIENEQMRKKIAERNSELVQLTLQTGKTIQTLNSLMDKLKRLTQNANQLRKQIEVRERAVEQIKREIAQVKKEKIQQERKNKSVRQHLEEVRVPSILDYVKVKAELDVIRKEVTNWERKVEISDVNRKLYRTKLRKIENDFTMTK